MWIKQLIVFQSLVLLFKIRQDKKAGYLFDKITRNFGIKPEMQKIELVKPVNLKREQPKNSSPEEQTKTGIICQIISERLLHWKSSSPSSGCGWRILCQSDRFNGLHTVAVVLLKLLRLI